RGSGRKRLAASGDPDPASRPSLEVDAITSHGRRNPRRTSPRDSGAPRPLREDARPAPLVGLVCALPERPRERQQSGGGRHRRRPLYGGGPSVLSSMTAVIRRTVGVGMRRSRSALTPFKQACPCESAASSSAG